MKDLQFTFGIITDGKPERIQGLKDVCSSIYALNIPKFEILIVGNTDHIHAELHNYCNLQCINFNENKHPGWITRKKNIITETAKYENIVYQHDYIIYKPDWYAGFVQFGDEFKVCINKIINFHEERGESENRFRDLVLDYWSVKERLRRLDIDERACIIPYADYEERLTPYMYISGAYWVAKKQFMLSCPLNERLKWGQGEDVEFSKRARTKTNFRFNSFSTVKLNKPGTHRVFVIMTSNEINMFKNSIGIN